MTKNISRENFTYTASSDPDYPDYKDLGVEIKHNSTCIAVIDQEKGFCFENITFLDTAAHIEMNLESFINILNKAFDEIRSHKTMQSH